MEFRDDKGERMKLSYCV